MRQALRGRLNSVEAEQCLEVIDVLEVPQRAIADNIFATPTLTKVSPPPSKRIINHLNDGQRIMEELELAINDDD